MKEKSDFIRRPREEKDKASKDRERILFNLTHGLSAGRKKFFASFADVGRK